jgi:hypothetical protein
MGSHAGKLIAGQVRHQTVVGHAHPIHGDHHLALANPKILADAYQGLGRILGLTCHDVGDLADFLAVAAVERLADDLPAGLLAPGLYTRRQGRAADIAGPCGVALSAERIVGFGPGCGGHHSGGAAGVLRPSGAHPGGEQ